MGALMEPTPEQASRLKGRLRAAGRDATPAPLDPSAVKAGDTVTLERDGGRLPDQVVATPSMSMGGCTTLILKGGIEVKVTGPDAWTLTDHQPAPEPEPEWKPGQVGTATISGCSTTASIFDRHGMFFRRGDGPLTFMTDDGSTWYDHLLTDFVPDEPRTQPTREDVVSLMEGDHGYWMTDGATDDLMALLRGEPR